MKRLRNVNGNTTYIYKEISFITILHVTTRRQSIAKPPMEDSYGRLHMNIDVREIKQVVNILHIHQTVPGWSAPTDGIRRREWTRTIDEYVKALYEQLTECLQLAQESASKEAKRQKWLYDRKVGAVELRPGDRVLVRLDAF